MSPPDPTTTTTITSSPVPITTQPPPRLSHPHPLTQHLLTTTTTTTQSPFIAATQAPFLAHAGRGTLSPIATQRWLAQDRLYAQAYVRFAALVLAGAAAVPVSLPASLSGGTAVPTVPSTDESVRLNEKLQDLLVDALVNIRRELAFFEDVARRYGFDLFVGEGDGEGVKEGVRLYRALFQEMGDGVQSGEVEMLDALVVLWGTEKCYLEAWRYAASFSPSEPGPAANDTVQTNTDRDGGALRKEFIPNWTSPEFEAFVDQIAAIVDALWEGDEDGLGGRGELRNGELLEGTWERGERAGRKEKLERLEGLWMRVLDVERVFWPLVDAEGKGEGEV